MMHREAKYLEWGNKELDVQNNKEWVKISWRVCIGTKDWLSKEAWVWIMSRLYVKDEVHEAWCYVNKHKVLSEKCRNIQRTTWHSNTCMSRFASPRLTLHNCVPYKTFRQCLKIFRPLFLHWKMKIQGFISKCFNRNHTKQFQEADLAKMPRFDTWHWLLNPASGWCRSWKATMMTEVTGFWYPCERHKLSSGLGLAWPSCCWHLPSTG